MAIKNPFIPRLLRLIKNCYLDMKYGNQLLLKTPQNWNRSRGWHASQHSDYQAEVKKLTAVSFTQLNAAIICPSSQGF